MMWWALLLQTAPLPSPTPVPTPAPVAHPVTGVDLHPGDSMIVRPGADGVLTVVDRRPGDRKPGAGEVRIDLRSTPAGTTLAVANASPRILLYRALIGRGGARPQPTSICPVLPDGKFGIENWPYAIDRVILYGFRYEDHPPMTCR